MTLSTPVVIEDDLAFIAAPVSHIDPSATPVAMEQEAMEALTGLYLISGGMLQLFVELVDDQLYVIIPAQGLTLALTPMSDGHFATELEIPFWLTPAGDTVLFAQGPNRDAVLGYRVDSAQFIPDEDFMENWYGYTFKAYLAEDFYVMHVPSITFGVTEEGFAYSASVVLNMPGVPLVALESMDTGIQLQYEDGEYFFNYWGIRFVRQ